MCKRGKGMQNNKAKLITPLLMLFAGAVASVIMYVKKYEFYKMLWILLVVLVVFYIIGDVVRYLYESVRPSILPKEEIDEMLNALENGGLEADADTQEEAEETSADEGEADEETDESDEYGEQEEAVEEYTDENLDEM